MSHASSRLDRLRSLISSLEDIVSLDAEEDRILGEVSASLQQLVAHDDWLPAAYAEPNPERYSQYLLHCDSKERFSVVSFVWGPGQKTPIHDHTVWGVVGMLRGAELSQSFVRTEGGLELGPLHRLEPGDVEPLSPRRGDIHSVDNAYDDRVSISIHVYGGNIGAIERSVFHMDGSRRPFVSRYSPAPLPNLWAMAISPSAVLPSVSPLECRRDLITGREIAIVDLREEGTFATGHPLFAANLPLSRLELIVPDRLPRKDVKVVLYDDGEGLVDRGAEVMRRLGLTNIARLEGGLAGWRAAGYEMFIDVNSYSKAFGELVFEMNGTPTMGAEEVQSLIDAAGDAVILDARRFEEYRTMSIPGGVSVPGAELVLRAQAIAPDPATLIIVNCAGRTRSLIGAQSLINAGFPNRVAALRNGTIGWLLAGQTLEHGQQRRFGDVDADQVEAARQRARAVSYHAGVRRLDPEGLADLVRDRRRTLYRFDVRTPEEYSAGHIPGFLSAPGGQLVQETDMCAPVRGARIVLADDQGVRADMTASWLAQMGWEVYVLDGGFAGPLELGGRGSTVLDLAAVPQISPVQLSGRLARGDVVVIDLAGSPVHARGHIPGAWFAIRAHLGDNLGGIPAELDIALTSDDGVLAHIAGIELAASSGRAVHVLTGGTRAWVSQGYKLETGIERTVGPVDDIYKRPYEGTANSVEAMQAYLDWEYGLVEQLRRDGTHGFHIVHTQRPEVV